MTEHHRRFLSVLPQVFLTAALPCPVLPLPDYLYLFATPGPSHLPFCLGQVQATTLLHPDHRPPNGLRDKAALEGNGIHFFFLVRVLYICRLSPTFHTFNNNNKHQLARQQSIESIQQIKSRYPRVNKQSRSLKPADWGLKQYEDKIAKSTLAHCVPVPPAQTDSPPAFPSLFSSTPRHD